MGTSELVAALLVGLKFAPSRRAAASVLTANQFCAAIVHLSCAEVDALPRSAMLIALCIIVVIYRR